MTADWQDEPMFDIPPVAVDAPAPLVELDPVEEASAAVSGRAGGLVRGDAVRLPLRDESVDLIVTSPPYFALRSYQDGGEHYDNQIGSEESPQAFLEALWAVTAECARVLKPSGSMFINLGDKYAGSGGHNNNGISRHGTGSSTLQGNGKPDVARRQALLDHHRSERRNAPDRYNQNSGGVPAKSLMLLPERYRIGCVDRLGLICRAVVVWSKPNGLPESVSDRVRRSHEDWVHLTKLPQYFSAVDEIREQYSDAPKKSGAGWLDRNEGKVLGRATDPHGGLRDQEPNPLGKLPGSVWTVPTEPLRVPDWLGVDHFAAFPTEWPRRLILGWSPSGVCCGCGQGRRPIVEKKRTPRKGSTIGGEAAEAYSALGGCREDNWWTAADTTATITGEVCACPDTTAPTRPAVILDPFVGTGTVPMVARSLGRHGVGVDLSADYLRLARWRVYQSGGAAKAVSRTWRERQGGLFDEVVG